MANSTASSSFSSVPLTPPTDFSGLPIHSMRTKILDKILHNRVTLIVGETGCGKSSQVPQFLLEQNIEPILCTQPRRFAVVAISRMVAKARNCEVGSEVGYHIGHSKVLSARSKIVFKTAGVLLEEMRDKGLSALKYKVIILDEVHERSVESDLVLVCVKQFLLKQNDLRLVLMSATADTARYKEYFKDLGTDERVEVLAIPSSPQHKTYELGVSYLEQVAELLGMSSDSLALRYCSGPRLLLADAAINSAVHQLILDLVIHIHKNEPDMEKSILIFLPTYQSLEQQWFSLKRFTKAFKIHILHSSIDTEQALRAMKICKSHRKVILATNIAESSVTIPKVAYVIDSCRSLQVSWDYNCKKEATNLVWVSKSQADQRKGRTGRTCDGHVYRLVTGKFFSQLEDYESPSILRLSLRQQVLLLCCSSSKAINDPKVLLKKALDPPDPEVVKDALSLLVHTRALERPSLRGRYEPTFYGRLLASFSLSFDAAVLVLKFGDKGMLRDGILLGILMDIQPLPILRPFGQDVLFGEYTNGYYSGDGKKTGLTGKKEISFMANLSAFQFWQRVFRDKHRLERLKELFKPDGAGETQFQLPIIEDQWCLSHNLVQSSLHHIAEIYEDVLSSLHRFRPKSLVVSDGLPSYYNPCEFQHTCLLKCVHNENGDALAVADDELVDPVKERKCSEEQFVAPNHFRLDEVAEKLVAIIKEIRIQYIEDMSANQENLGYIDGPHISEEAPLCRYFVSGMCNRGDNCVFSHSLQAKKPVCNFFFSLQGCRNGDSCFFSHDMGLMPPLPQGGSNLCQPEEEDVDGTLLLQLFPAASDGYILLLDDTDFRFSSKLTRYYDPSSIICTTSLARGSVNDPSLVGVKIMYELFHPYQSIINKAGENPIPWKQVKCILWYPMLDGGDENREVDKSVVQTFFEYLAIRVLTDSLYEAKVILTMNNIRFSQLQVEKLAKESFFFLKESFPYDQSSFGVLPDTVRVKKSMVVSKPVCYVFKLHAPSKVQNGNYTAILH